LKYRVSASVYLDEEGEAIRIFEGLKRARDLFLTIRRGEPNEQRSFVALERCYHDEEPPRPCEVVERTESE